MVWGGVASLAVILRWLPGSEKCSFPLSTLFCKGLVIGMHSGRESNPQRVGSAGAE